MYRVFYSCVSHVGRCRSTNQDNFICDGKYREAESPLDTPPFAGFAESDQLPVFGVFDGMGGEECGDIAALLAAEGAAQITVGDTPTGDLIDFCRRVNARICGYADKNGISAMGTTAALLAFTKKEVAICNIGDSRIFRLSKGKMEQLSVDHVGVASYGRKPPLSQNLGIPPTEMLIEPYVSRSAYRDGDIYLICSDGLTDMLSTDQVAQILNQYPIEKASGCLLEKTLESGGRDNITIILCRTSARGRFPFSGKLREF